MSTPAPDGPQGRRPSRWLLAAYPRGYRAAHGEEILAVLAEAAGPGRRIPPLREIAGLMRGGLLTRPRYAAEEPVPWWADGIHLGIFVLALVDFAPLAANVLDAAIKVAGHPGFHYSPWWYPWYEFLPLAVAVALMRGWVWAALPPSAAMVFETSRGLGGLPHLLRAIPYYGPAAHTGSAALPAWLILAGLITLAALRPRALRNRSWCWWLPVLLGVLGAEEYALGPGDPQWQVAQTTITAGLLALAFWATAVSGDLRWALATTIVVITGVLSAVRNLPANLHHITALGYASAMMLVLVAMVLAAHRTRRPQA